MPAAAFLSPPVVTTQNVSRHCQCPLDKVTPSSKGSEDFGKGEVIIGTVGRNLIQDVSLSDVHSTMRCFLPLYVFRYRSPSHSYIVFALQQRGHLCSATSIPCPGLHRFISRSILFIFTVSCLLITFSFLPFISLNILDLIILHSTSAKSSS